MSPLGLNKGAVGEGKAAMAVGPIERSRSQDVDEDGLLLASIKARDPRAFEALYRLHRPRLARFVTRLVGRPWLVDEVVNDTMMVVWYKPDSYRGASRFSTWLFAIAYRKAAAARLRQDVAVVDPLAEERASEACGPDREFDQRSISAALAAALSSLSSDHRAVVHLTYFQEMGYREIAEIMDCPVDTVKTRMFHARRHLRRALSGDLADWL